jgi:hypothetical protein
MVTRKENAATQLAALIIPSVGNNKLRHESLQRFMLANDSSTVAVEIPVWMTADDIAEIERRYGIDLAAGDSSAAVTGHIDFLQVRNGAIHILDYKPDARTNRPIAQLAIYALALSSRTGLNLFDIKCAWFNEEEYCEFFPRSLFSSGRANRDRAIPKGGIDAAKGIRESVPKNTALDVGNLTSKPNPRRSFRRVYRTVPPSYHATPTSKPHPDVHS